MTNKNSIQEVSSLLDQYNKELSYNDQKPQENRRSARSYAFCLSTYIEFDKVIDFLRGAHWISHWSACPHDKDVWTKKDNENDPSHIEGVQKEPHTHIVLYTFNGKSSSSVRKLFDRYSIEIYGADNKQNTLCQVCNDVGAQYRYQLHLDDPDRYPYYLTPEIRVTDNSNYWKKFEVTDGMNSPDNKGLAMVEALLSGVPYRTLCEQFGKDFIYHFPAIYNMSRRIYRQEQGVKDFDEKFIQSYLNTSPFLTSDINKFWEILGYLKLSISCDYKIGNDLKFILEEKLK